jgi:dTDP-4-amino-4,6-dideoxygalactose transaminase
LTADVTCYSFYANKTITTGEGGMATLQDAELAARIRSMSLHGLSHDAWNRYTSSGSWDYQIIAPGYKYNMTDIAASLGLHQLARAEELRQARAALARQYNAAFAELEEIETPAEPPDRIHAWHLYPLKLRLTHLEIERNRFIEELKQAGVGCSVHWRPLHLHPYYREQFGWQPGDLPVASAVWQRLVSLPLFPGMRAEETAHVINTVQNICARHQRRPATVSQPKANGMAVNRASLG